MSEKYKYFGFIPKDSTAGKNLETAEDALIVFSRVLLILFVLLGLPAIVTSCENADLEEYD